LLLFVGNVAFSWMTPKTRVQEEILVIPGKVIPDLDFNVSTYLSSIMDTLGIEDFHFK
jgi:hypothetical protein